MLTPLINTDYCNGEKVSYLLKLDELIEIFINLISLVMFTRLNKLKLSNFSEVISNYSTSKFRLLYTFINLLLL